MRKFSAILLAALFLFNLLGYRLVFNCMQHQADVTITASINNNHYAEAELVMVKVPLSLPYISDQENFERVSGEITINGKILKYVKRKISGGNLILMCLPDENKMKIASAKNHFFAGSNDLNQNDQSQKSGTSKSTVFKNLSVEYDTVFIEYSTFPDLLASSYCIESSLNFLPSSFYSIPEQPPELC